MKKIISLVLFVIGLGSLSAQSFVWKLNHHFYDSPKVFAENDTLKILAVMVEFQKDNDGNTYGDGKFGSIYTKEYGDTILDPLPHNAQYFENHLEFAKNYFLKVSSGKLNVAYKVLPQVLTVSKIMREYSPTPTNQTDYTNLGKFAEEVWQLAGTTFGNVDFSQYDIFTIFHAGVGKEFTTPGSLGNERDIPSVYLSLKSLQTIFGSGFTGFAVNNSTITNTMILPSTESREYESVGTKTLLQLTTNGLIVSSIASYLGLPDLFNTATGSTAIGRLGLMDGDAIFAYSGVFPPEPSAWEKIYLGWAEPVVVNPGTVNLSVAAKLAASANDTTILKIPINSTEYFLVENRQRDVNKDGANITYKIGSQTFSFKAEKDTGRFRYYDADTLRGVITDVDEFDWAAPGNGIVIWHIDENIINEKIADNKINADLERKGVDVEEADGIQDLGEKFTLITGETVYGEATQKDMWYSGNNSRYYKNKFSPDTKPNTNSNTGANSLITMQNFSAPANKMSFIVNFGSGDIQLLASKQLELKSTPKSLTAGQSYKGLFHFLDGNDLIEIDSTGNILKRVENFSNVQITDFTNQASDYVIGAFDKKINLYIKNNSEELVKSVNITSNVTTPVVIYFKNDEPYVFVGTENGELIDVKLGSLLQSENVSQDAITKIGDEPILQICSPMFNGYFSAITQNYFYDAANGKVSLPYVAKKAALLYTGHNEFTTVVLTANNNFYIIKNGKTENSFTVSSSTELETFSVADLKNDGNLYIVVSNGKNIEAYNLEGVIADGFPFIASNKQNFIGTPLSLGAFDISENNSSAQYYSNILAFTGDGSIYFIRDVNEQNFNAIQLTNGATISTTPVIHLDENLSTYRIILIDQTNMIYNWKIDDAHSNSGWLSEYGSFLNNATAYFSSSVKPTDFFPTDRAYNWPNPVYGSETNIRYYVSENSNVTIKIFDLAGDLVASLNDNAVGGLDNETVWNVSNVQSGIYYASIEVKSDSGKSANKIIKIAVVK